MYVKNVLFIQRSRKNITYNDEKNESIKTHPEMTQMLELSKKDFKTYYNCIHYIQNLSRDMEDLQKIQIELIVMKAIVLEMKNTRKGISGRLDIIEERINELEEIAIEAIQNETQLKE